MDRHPAIMFQGTASSAGKSVLAAALCRLLASRGLNVAPFKAQNMSLNSHVTLGGEEIGRAQALQARACYLEADARMNPVLLKPLGNHVSQVLIMGKPVGNMTWQEYVKAKPDIWREVASAWQSLARERDIMVLEGAGSPAEINLRSQDIVNMRMAAHAGARVALIADIDRGGAFAALTGTMALLRPRDRGHVAGYVLNRFRGDKALLTPALEHVATRTRRPFFGIMPMLADLRLPDEDSASLPGRYMRQQGAGLDIALVNLPQISNYTDFDPLSREPDVALRMVDDADDFGNPDLVLLPGSRNVGACVDFLRRSGLFERLRQYGEAILKGGNGSLAGICAGLQLLGGIITDRDDIEGGTTRGLGLLPVETEFLEEKILARSSGHASPELCGSPCPVSGYEIRHGRVRACAGAMAVIWRDDGEAAGWGRSCAGKLDIWGTSIHGIFDSDDFRHGLLNRLRSRKELPEIAGACFDIDRELDRLAQAFAENVDVKALLGPFASML